MSTPAAKKRAPQKPRVGKNGSASYKIAGIELPCDPDLEFEKPTPTPLFPSYHPSKPKPLTKDEKIEIAHFRALRDNIHQGPLYTVLGDNVRVGKTGNTSAAANFDPFEGMPTYSKKYSKQRRRLPKLDTRPYVLKFFPEELWSTIDPSSTATSGISSPQTSKKLQLAKPDGLKEFDDELSGDNDETDALGEKNVEDEDEGMEEEVDDEYEEDDDEGGDYNAEQYFDDGGDDAGDDYDGGEDGGVDSY